jgi:hypothetical protein
MLIASLYGYGALLILAAIVIAIINADELKNMDDLIDIENERYLEARNAKQSTTPEAQPLDASGRNKCVSGRAGVTFRKR